MTGKDAFGELRKQAEVNGDVLFIRMHELRDGVGKARLGKYVCEEIEEELRRRGLGSTELSTSDAWAGVLIFVMGSEVERIVRAVLDPSEVSAAVLQEIASNSAPKVLRQIKALLEGID